MKKIKYLYIPIGGTGRRLHIDCPHLEYSSKCFLSFNGKTLLQRIIEQCEVAVEEIMLIYCSDSQRKDAEEYFRSHPISLPVHLIYNADADPYSSMPPIGDCLAVMGDSFVPTETWKGIFNSIASDPCLTFLRFFPKTQNQDFAYYHLKGNDLLDWSHDRLDGYTHFEIGQLLYFPPGTAGEAVRLCMESDALTMLRFFIRSPRRVKCLALPCYNINTGADYVRVSALILNSNSEDNT